MKYMTAVFLCIILAFSFGCTKTASTGQGDMPNAEKTIPQDMAPDLSIPEGFERRVHRTYSMIMPADWSEIEYGNIIIYLPPGSEAADPISEKVQVIAVGFPKENRQPLKDILEAGIEDSKKLVPDLVMTKEEDITVGNAYAVRMVFTGTIQGKKFENVQTTTVNKDIILHFIHNCFSENCNHPDIYSMMVDSVVLNDYTDDER